MDGNKSNTILWTTKLDNAQTVKNAQKGLYVLTSITRRKDEFSQSKFGVDFLFITQETGEQFTRSLLFSRSKTIHVKSQQR